MVGKSHLRGLIRLMFLGVVIVLLPAVNLPRVPHDGVGVSVHIDAEGKGIVKFHFSAEAQGPYQDCVRVAVAPGENFISTVIPADRIRQLRLGFGSMPGKLVARDLVLEGADRQSLCWRDFKPNASVPAFDISEDGREVVAQLGASGQFATYMKPLNCPSRSKANMFVYCCRAFCLAFVALGFLLVMQAKRVTITSRDMCLLFGLVLVSFVRFYITLPMPAMFSTSSWDDVWFVKAGDYLLSGRWLGPYEHHTLIKGCFGPMVLAFSKWIGIPFLTFSTLLYILSCLAFVLILAHEIRCRWFLFGAFCFLVFCPLSFNGGNWQKIYRNGMVLWQLPLLVGSLFKCWLHRFDMRRLTAWLSVIGVVLWMFFNTREDGMWIWPFVICWLVLSACVGGKWNALPNYRSACRIGLFALPLLILLLGNVLLGMINKTVYGVFLRNDRDAGNYAKAMKDFYLIKPDPKEEERLSQPGCSNHYHNIYFSTVRKAYSISPTFATARVQMDRTIESWVRIGRLPDGEPYGDHVLFAMRIGAYNAGYYKDLETSERFWGSVHEELSAAFADGRLAKRGVALTAMAAPFQVKFLPRFVKEFKYAVLMAINCHDVKLWVTCQKFPPALRSLFVRMSGSVDPDENCKSDVKPYVDRLMGVALFYSHVSFWFVSFSFVVYLVWSVLALKNRRLEGMWLLATGVLFSGLLHSACIAYMSASTFWATGPAYLCPSYLCAHMFVVVVMARFGGFCKELFLGYNNLKKRGCNGK